MTLMLPSPMTNTRITAKKYVLALLMEMGIAPLNVLGIAERGLLMWLKIWVAKLMPLEKIWKIRYALLTAMQSVHKAHSPKWTSDEEKKKENAMSNYNRVSSNFHILPQNHVMT